MKIDKYYSKEKLLDLYRPNNNKYTKQLDQLINDNEGYFSREILIPSNQERTSFDDLEEKNFKTKELFSIVN